MRKFAHTRNDPACRFPFNLPDFKFDVCWRGRPANIGSVVAEFEAAVKAGLPRVVDLWKWSDREVRTFTIDNIHFSRPGFKRLTALIEAELV